MIISEMPQGSGGNYAWIRVRTTDPILFNQNVTASINSKTLGADTISAYSGVGVACVAVPKKGTYTVTAKNAYDGKTVTQTATVSEKGQVVECYMQSTYSTLTVNVYDKVWTKNRMGGTYKLYKDDVVYAEGTLSTSGPTTIISQPSEKCKISILANAKKRTIEQTKDITMAIGETTNVDFYAVVNVETVSFSGCTDDEFVSIVNALDNEDISVSELPWTVGDTRKVEINDTFTDQGTYFTRAETVTFVIQNVGGVTMSSGKECHYVVGLLNCLSKEVNMNSTDTTKGSWNGSERKRWLNNKFMDAIPSKIRGCFKQFHCVTVADYNATTTTTSSNYFALPAAKEVFGDKPVYDKTGFSNETEFDALKQFDWYKTSANRIKKLGNNGSTIGWWLRSPASRTYDGYANFCAVGTDGTPCTSSASTENGLSPYGCI